MIPVAIIYTSIDEDWRAFSQFSLESPYASPFVACSAADRNSFAVRREFRKRNKCPPSKHIGRLLAIASLPTEWVNSFQDPAFLVWYERPGADLPVIMTATNACTYHTHGGRFVLKIDIYLFMELTSLMRGVGCYVACDVY